MNKTTALALSLAAISSVVVVEGIGGLLTNSLALLSDALHALFDTLATLTLLAATYISLKPPDETHTYGHGKIESIGGFVGGLLLFALGINIVFSASNRLIEGTHAVEASLVGFLAILYTLSVDVFRIFVLHTSLKVGESATVRVDLFHAFSDLSSTLIALAGLFSASINFGAGDTIAALVLCSLIFYLSLKTIYRTGLELSDAIPPSLFNKVKTVFQTHPKVEKFSNLKMRRVGDKVFVEVEVTIPQDLSIKDADILVEDLQKRVQDTVGKSELSVKLKPSLSRLTPIQRIHLAAGKVEGVKGVHKVALTNVSGTLHITLHIEVDPNLSSEKAHKIAEEFERVFSEEIGEVGSVTLHIEPAKEQNTAFEVKDSKLIEGIRDIIIANSSVKEVKMIRIYSDEKNRYATIRCTLKDNPTVEEAHNLATELEKKISEAYRNLNVTLQIEAEEQ
ncbi:MAG: cation diffusion facilitator family transporter [Nitrososphaerales archaeon]